MKQQRLFEALSYIGDDLLWMAEHTQFTNPWKKWGSLAACLALVLSLTVLALPYFPIGCGASKESVRAEEEIMEETAAEENREESKAEVTVEEETEETLEEAPADAEQGETLLSIWFQGQRYALLPSSVTAEPEDLGQLLGTVERWDGKNVTGQELAGSEVYAVTSQEERIYVKTGTDYWLCIPAD